MGELESQLTVRVSEELRAAVEARAWRLQRKSSEIVRMAIEAFVLEELMARKPADRVRHLLGSLDSKTPDLTERHRQYVLKSLRHER